ncbi:helix-turn-helix transcriptional regulator [Marinoscillum luteum]|uniref:Helix-turn-helix transcriptional regulator n=1 Tax=Marinoscillum luteum TaxID=861051 RepID=A0ABW7N7C2_9BACT
MMFASQFPDQSTISRLRNQPSPDGQHLTWPDVLVQSRYRTYEKSVPESSFALFALKSPGEATFRVGGKHLRICQQTLCLINPYEAFEYRIEANEAVEVQNLHLSLSTYRQLMHAMGTSPDRLLNHPAESEAPAEWPHHLYYMDPAMKGLLDQYHSLNSEDFLTGIGTLLQRLSAQNQQVTKRIPSQKRATQKELAKRVAMGRDLIFSAYNDPDLTLDRICAEVFMSKFHFIRVFKQAYGLTPHQLIRHIRILKAQEYLKTGQMTLEHIAYKVGLQEPNSLYPLLRTAEAN